MTFTLMARDPWRGDLGVAVASHWPAVGGVVPFFRPGVGMVASQSQAWPPLAEAILDAMAGGASPREAVAAMVTAFTPGVRQILAMGVTGRNAIFTGAGCVRETAEARGPNCIAAGNMLIHEGVAQAMVDAYTTTAAERFADRLLVGLRAGEAAGGDKRGRQAAAIRIWPADYPAAPWLPFDVRADDHGDPLAELARLLPLRRDAEETPF